MRKVKFTQDTIDEKLSGILSEFPILDNLHPFLASLLNVLYDKKSALLPPFLLSVP
jgi:nucleolar GTP-binding protein